MKFSKANRKPICSGDPNRPNVALTFDDGPDDQVTPKLLDVFKKHGIKATFFCVGECVNEHPDIVKREDEEGHLVANHSYTHADLTLLDDVDVLKELRETNCAIMNAIGKTPVYFRPPHGYTDIRVNDLAKKICLTPICWTGWPFTDEGNTRDYELFEKKAIVDKLTSAQNGWIFLCHDGLNDECAGGIKFKGPVIEAIDEAILQLHLKGFNFVTIADLLAMSGTVVRALPRWKYWIRFLGRSLSRKR